jgi:hypothetical protein
MPDHQLGRPRDPEHDHAHSQLSEMELRVRALESVLTQKGYIEPTALDLLIGTYEKKIGPHNGARVVAKAWIDEEFKQRLLASPTPAIASLGYAGFQGEHMVHPSSTIWSSARCAPAIRGQCWGFHRCGTSRRRTARGRSRTLEACCVISVWNFLPRRKFACGIRPPRYGISYFQCVRSGPTGGAKNASHRS